ncbi:MOSC domain-containing protein [Flavobacteriaceae bacterium]|nr:MOSC domain-containing protein [Flavobacteriaceae bacterium]
MKIVSTNIGRKQTLVYKGKEFHTGIIKKPVNDGIDLDFEDVDGDQVIDRKHHGGVDQAVYAFGLDQYPHYREMFPDLDWHHGMFGENLTVDQMDESQLFQGNQYQLGEAIVEVTIPRQPCSTLGARFGDMKVVKEFWNSTHPGSYFKIIQRGRVRPGDEFVLIKTCAQNPSIAAQFEAKK